MIEFNEFSFRYREGAEPVVRDITLSIPDGCFVGITGAAGSGKSTLTYAINGIIPHCYPGDFYGSVTVEGCDTVDTSLTDLSRLVGSVCQDIDSQMVSTVVEDEILYGLENFAVPREEIPARVDEALASMGIADLRDRTIDSLSGGPVGVLLGAGIGLVAGMAMDDKDVDDDDSLMEYCASELAPGATALVMLAKEDNEDALDAQFDETCVIYRWDADEVNAEVERAEALNDQLAAETRKQLREARKKARKARREARNDN